MTAIGVRRFAVVLITAFGWLFSIPSTGAFKPTIRFINLSRYLIPYQDAWDLQRRVVNLHVEAQRFDSNVGAGTIICLQHPHVYTLGTGTSENSGPFSRKCSAGLPLDYDTVKVDRAGQATYHGPGQLVFYPILDLNHFDKDINVYLRNLEQIVISLCADYGIKASLQPGLTGVWVDDAKIAAIGIKLTRWVTMHGVSINVKPDMRYFRNIIPCGIVDKAVGSLVDFNPSITLDRVAADLPGAIERCFDAHCVQHSHESLLQELEMLEQVKVKESM